MPESPPGLSIRPPWRIHADDLREQLQRIPRHEEAIGNLSKWFEVLRGPLYEAQNTDERLQAALASETDNPVVWCFGVPAYLPPELKALLSDRISPDAPAEILDPLIRYALGRACMKSMMLRPSDTAGLSLAYGLLWPLAHDGIAYAGADDELLHQLVAATEARVEIEAEARRLGENPIGAARRFDRDRTAQAIQQASSPESLEACTHWQIRGLHLDLHFGRVIQVIGSSDTALAAKLLDTIGNAALVATVMRGSGILDIPAKANLLRSVSPVFDLKNCWTGRTTAWIILLDIEERLSEPLQEQVRVVRSGGTHPPAPGAIVEQEVAVAAEALLSRPDGARLALEWLAHLLWSTLLLRTPATRAGGDNLSALEPLSVLLQALGAHFGREDWANPLRVWALFGGSPLVTDVSNSYRPAQELPLLLPLWRDWLGQPNTFGPIAVAVYLWDYTVSSPGWLAKWIRLLCQDLEGHPAMLQLVEAEPSQAARYLAWPLVRSGRPSERFGELWSDAGRQLTRARFAKIEKAADAVQPCVALIRVGLHMLEWSTLNSVDDAGGFASLLADAVDEVRYTLPEIGIAQWSTMAGKLAGVMAAIGLLKDGGCERLLARYDGDDDSLAAAAINAAANGVPAWEVRQALASIGVEAGELAERWETWNARFARDEGGRPSNYLAQLLAIGEAVAKPP